MSIVHINLWLRYLPWYVNSLEASLVKVNDIFWFTFIILDYALWLSYIMSAVISFFLKTSAVLSSYIQIISVVNCQSVKKKDFASFDSPRDVYLYRTYSRRCKLTTKPSLNYDEDSQKNCPRSSWYNLGYSGKGRVWLALHGD